MKRLLLLSLLGICLSSFAADDKMFVVHYAVRLAEVVCDRATGFVQDIKAETFDDLDGLPYSLYRYSDDVISMTWQVADKSFNYTILNKADSAMAIHTSQIFARDWDNRPASFGHTLEKPEYGIRLDIPGKSMTNGDQSVTLGDNGWGGGEFCSGILIPMRNYPDADLLPSRFGTRKEAERVGSRQEGKTYRMILPVYVGQTLFNYRLTFVVDRVVAVTEDSSGGPDEPEFETASPEMAMELVDEPSAAQPEPVSRTKQLYAPLLRNAVDLSGPMAGFVRQMAYFNAFNRSCPQEKVYLHLDNTSYFQGETVWYAANVVDATTGGAAASKVLYVELLSPTGVVLKQQKLKVVDGRCHGSFALIDTDVEEAVALRGAIGYPSGYYQIRAYTHAQLNFDDAGIFSRVIPVYKAPETEGKYENPVMRQYKGKETARPEAAKARNLNVTFYPEGGDLVAGADCRIAFKATDEHGLGVEIERITDEDGNELRLAPLQHKGMGSFMYLVPNDRLNRSVKVHYGGKDHSFALPKAKRNGCALLMERTADRQRTVTVTARALGADSVLAYTVTHEGRVCAFDTLHLACPAMEPVLGSSVVFSSFTIPEDSLPTGVCQFTLCNPEGRVYAQRLFFADGDPLPVRTLSVTADNTDINPFGEVKLSFQINGKGVPQQVGKPAVFSLAVRDAADYGTAYRDDIRTYMLLSSELKGLIEDPGWYFALEEGRSQKEEGLDLLMMVQGWTRYDWRLMAGAEPFYVRHYTEEQLVLDGWAFSRLRETPLANAKIAVRLTSPDRQQVQETTVTTDSIGYWSVGVQDFEGEWDLYMEMRQQGDKRGSKTTRIRLERAAKPALYSYTPLETWLPDYAWDPDKMLTVEEAKDTEYLLPGDSHLLDEVEITGQRRYIDFYTFKAFDAAKDAELMLDEGKYTYKVEDYLRAKGYDVQYSIGDVGDMTNNDAEEKSVDRFEYYKEMVQAAPINNRRTFWYIHEGKTNRTMPSYFAGYALDLEEVKSIIVYDSPTIYETFEGLTDILTISEIKALAGEDESGVRKFAPGLYIVDIELNPARKRRTYVDKNARSTSFSGYSPVVEFYAPTYPNGPVQGDLDFRRTIYWNPEVTTDADGHASVRFYNNGYSRALTVSAQGLTADGVPLINAE